jgi:hypothetical protein
MNLNQLSNASENNCHSMLESSFSGGYKTNERCKVAYIGFEQICATLFEGKTLTSALQYID